MASGMTGPAIGPVDHAHTSVSRPVLLITTVDIGDGKSDQIEYRKGDDAVDIARLFVTKHGLPTSITLPLAQHILDNLKQALSSTKNAGSAKCSPRGNSPPPLPPPRCATLARPAPVKAQGPSPQPPRPHSPLHSQSAEDAAVFQRLYAQAIKLRSKLEERRAAVAQEEEEKLSQNKVNMSWISQEMMKDRSHGPFENYGEMLYAEGLEALAKKQSKAQRYKQQKEEAEVEGATFQPEISRLAQSLWSATELQQAPAWQRLSNQSKKIKGIGKKSKTQERLEMLRREKEDAETSECTFQPQINSRSNKLMTERTETLKNLNVTAHQQLFQDAIRRQHKQAEYANWYPQEVTFQPKLVDNTLRSKLHRKAAQRNGLQSTGGGELPLVDRLYMSYEKLQSKLEEARQKLEGPIDPITGRRLYHPEIGRGPQRLRNTNNMTVGEYLYQDGQERNARLRQALEEKERKALEDAKASKVTGSSQGIVRKLQRKRFRQIFEFVDQERTGIINLQEIMQSQPEYMEQLDDEVRADVEMACRIAIKIAQRQTKRIESMRSEATTVYMPPPTQEMLDSLAKSKKSSTSAPSSPRGNDGGSDEETTKLTIDPEAVNVETFYHLMDEALIARRGPRAYLAPSPPPKYQPPEDFHPRITQKSKQLAAKLRPRDIPVYEVLHQEASIISAKLDEKRRQATESEIKLCTFQPKLVSEPLVKEGKIKKALRNSNHSNIWKSVECAPGTCGSPEPLTATLEQLAAHLMAYENSDLSIPVKRAVESGAAHADHVQAAAAAKGAALDAAGGYQFLVSSLEAHPLITIGQLSTTDPVKTVEHGAEDDQRFMELEREVQEMLEATNVAAAAAERLSGASDQQYLSEILDLAQAQVDAMEPVMSSLPHWQSRQGANIHQSEDRFPEASPQGTDVISMSQFSVTAGSHGAGMPGPEGRSTDKEREAVNKKAYDDVDEAIRELSAEIGQLMQV